jgi:hypothetical protein
MELSAPMLRCGRVVSTSLPCTMMPSHLLDATADVRGIEISIQGMQCHCLRVSRLISSMSGELISWGHFLIQKAENTSWLSLTVSKWVEALPCRAAGAMHSKRMLHEVILLRYSIPRIVISDGGSHFIDRTF